MDTMNTTTGKPTLSICPVCYKEIDALIVFEGNSVFMVKRCSGHGKFKILVEPDASFYSMVKCFRCTSQYNDNCFFEITDRRNMECTFCFYRVQNQNQDPSIEELVQAYNRLPGNFRRIILAGAEPTVRNDLPELAMALSKAAVR